MEQAAFTDLAANVSLGIILLYLTFRIFKVLDTVVGKIASIQIVVMVGDQGKNHHPTPPSNAPKLTSHNPSP